MSDIWTMDCSECKGSGISNPPPTHDTYCRYCQESIGHFPLRFEKDFGWYVVCRIHGKLRVTLNLFKPCPTCSGKGGWWLGVAVPAEHKGGTGYYRPLTVEEVQELPRLPKLDLIAGRIDVMYDKQGSPVRLIGRGK